MISRVLLLFGSVNVFNSQYENCYLYADAVYFSVIYKAILCGGKAMSVKSHVFASCLPFCGMVHITDT